MTPPKPSDEAVEAALFRVKKDEDKMPLDRAQNIMRITGYWHTRKEQLHARGQILAAALHHERCELGHANDLLDQIAALCDGHGVGLRDAVQDVLAGR